MWRLVDKVGRAVVEGLRACVRAVLALAGRAARPAWRLVSARPYGEPAKGRADAGVGGNPRWRPSPAAARQTVA